MNIKKKKRKKNIGLLGGSFDPPHKGHLTVSTTAKKRFKLDHIIWAITKKNPFKKKSKLSLNERIKLVLQYKDDKKGRISNTGEGI